MSAPRRIAAIDLGTNTTLMLVAEVDAAHVLKALDDRATITRLGRGVDKTRMLEPAAMQRTLAVLREYADIARRWDAPIVAVGTSALRDAINRDEFLVPARAILGCEIEAIAGAREAEITFLGALEGIRISAGPLTVLDIGGGSTEIIIGDGPRITQRISLDFGSVRMHERHGVQVPATSEQLRAIAADVSRMLAECAMEPAPRLLAIAGTATTYAAMAYAVEPYRRDRIHGCALTRVQLTEQIARLTQATLEERRGFAGLHPDRADVILAGGVILDAVCAWCGVSEMTVSDGGVRYGLARQALLNA